MARVVSKKGSSISIRMEREKRQMQEEMGELDRLMELANDSLSAIKKQPIPRASATKRDPGVINVSELLGQDRQQSQASQEFGSI